MPLKPTSNRTHYSASHGQYPVIEDLAWSRDLSRNERMHENPDLRPRALASQSGDVTGQVAWSE